MLRNRSNNIGINFEVKIHASQIVSDPLNIQKQFEIHVERFINKRLEYIQINSVDISLTKNPLEENEQHGQVVTNLIGFISYRGAFKMIIHTVKI